MKQNIIYNKDQIRERIENLGHEISSFYGKEPVVVVCVLKGAFIFFADLVRNLDFDPEIDFVRLSSYAESTSSSGKMIFSKDMEVNVEGKHVLIVEDIVDTGYSMQFLVKVLEARGPKSVKICTLVNKQERREVDIQVDFSGFILDKGFIVGYGMDYAEKYRQLPYICDLISG